MSVTDRATRRRALVPFGLKDITVRSSLLLLLTSVLPPSLSAAQQAGIATSPVAAAATPVRFDDVAVIFDQPSANPGV
ncbi:hypothetical protein GGQ80_001630 [Sphingomonas jinjuensis]|uniref:Uncharacterized protein n=1 Tax=Sphingomonas jinjuensis TaxID=535907 RepID=A0A840FD92_9SPHN|nr:hypothetical protein [Sphingomonas jinjuensis]MBB4153724.1 hypothetical protein [Sphingomonas jinjuensis]